MSQLPVTIQGFLVADPVLTRTTNGNLHCRFRVASSRRVPVRDGAPDQWIDTDQLFIDVEMWGQFAANVRISLCKGVPVIVVGSLNSRTYEDGEKNKRSVTMIRATYVGLDLTRYKVAYTKSEEVRGADLPAEKLQELKVDVDKYQKQPADAASADSTDVSDEAMEGTVPDTVADTAADAAAAADTGAEVSQEEEGAKVPF